MRAFEIADAISPLSLSMYGLVSGIGGFMDRFDELPWRVTRPLVLGGVLLVIVSNALPVCFKAIKQLDFGPV
jgi:hypothetical protein